MTYKELGILKLAYCYIQNQISPSKVIPLDYFEGLLAEDLDCISEDMFEDLTYSKEKIEYILKEFSEVITKFENEIEE